MILSIKKLLLFSVILLLTVSLAFGAQYISAIGYGATESLALENAREELARTIRTSVYSETYSFSAALSTNTTNYGVENITSQTSISSNVELFATEIGRSVKNGNLYSIEIKLTEKSLPSYKHSLTQSVQTIETLSNSYFAENDPEQQKILLGTILDNLEKFDSAKYIILFFDPSFEIPPTSMTYDIAKTEYIKLLDSLSNFYALEEEALRLQISSDAAIKRLEIQQKQVENKLQRELLEAENKRIEMERLAKLSQDQSTKANARLQTMTENWDRLSSTTSSISADVSEAIANVESLRAEYRKIENAYDEDTKALIRTRFYEISRERSNIMNAEYSKAELNSQGNPIEAILKIREAQADAKEKEIIRNYQSEFDLIEQEKLNQLLRMGNLVNAELFKVNNQTFSIKSTSDKLTIQILGYDGDSGSWPVEIQANIAEVPHKFNFNLTYEDLTGKKQPDPNQYYGTPTWYEYVDEVEILDAIYSYNFKSLYAELSFNMKGTLDNSSYAFSNGVLKIYSSEEKDLFAPLLTFNNVLVGSISKSPSIAIISNVTPASTPTPTPTPTPAPSQGSNTLEETKDIKPIPLQEDEKEKYFVENSKKSKGLSSAILSLGPAFFSIENPPQYFLPNGSPYESNNEHFLFGIQGSISYLSSTFFSHTSANFGYFRFSAYPSSAYMGTDLEIDHNLFSIGVSQAFGYAKPRSFPTFIGVGFAADLIFPLNAKGAELIKNNYDSPFILSYYFEARIYGVSIGMKINVNTGMMQEFSFRYSYSFL